MDAIDDETFEDWVLEAIDMLPEQFRSRLGSVAIVIEEQASRDELDRLGVPGLYGLYHGVPRNVLGADHSLSPSKITIYRRPCIASARTVDGVRERVVDTVHHEIAHHFGISDARLRELGAGSHRH
jgi:predicted Zn-dependent protease with MMP-like domain